MWGLKIKTSNKLLKFCFWRIQQIWLRNISVAPVCSRTLLMNCDGGKQTSELRVRSQIVTVSKEELSQCHIMAGLKLSKEAVHGAVKHFVETGSVWSKAAKREQTLRRSIHETLFTERQKNNFITDSGNKEQDSNQEKSCWNKTVAVKSEDEERL